MTQDEKKIAEFVECYNKCMDWNQDLLNGLNLDIFHSKDFIDEYLTTEKIDESWVDLEHAKVFTYEDTGRLEMQAYNYKTYGTSYFWTFPDYTEESYKEKKLKKINEFLDEHLAELESKITELKAEKDEFSMIRFWFSQYKLQMNKTETEQ